MVFNRRFHTAEIRTFSGSRDFRCVHTVGIRLDCSSSEEVPEPFFSAYSRLGTFTLDKSHWGCTYNDSLLISLPLAPTQTWQLYESAEKEM